MRTTGRSLESNVYNVKRREKSREDEKNHETPVETIGKTMFKLSSSEIPEVRKVQFGRYLRKTNP